MPNHPANATETQTYPQCIAQIRDVSKNFLSRNIFTLEYLNKKSFLNEKVLPRIHIYKKITFNCADLRRMPSLLKITSSCYANLYLTVKASQQSISILFK